MIGIGDTLRGNPARVPELLVWFPNVHLSRSAHFCFADWRDNTITARDWAVRCRFSSDPTHDAVKLIN
jgi:hypothetical protein